MREVRCLSDDMLSSEGCDEQLKPAEKEDCHPEPCIPHIGQSSGSMILALLGSEDDCCGWMVAGQEHERRYMSSVLSSL